MTGSPGSYLPDKTAKRAAALCDGSPLQGVYTGENDYFLGAGFLGFAGASPAAGTGLGAGFGLGAGLGTLPSGAFPYVTLSLNPLGTLMRKGQHHTALHAGFGMISDLLNGPGGHTDNVYTRSFRYAGDSTAQGRPCYILRSDYPQFRYLTYRAGKNESITSVADRFGCGEYRIAERNNLDLDSKLTEGQVVQVPNAYGRRVIVLVDTKTYLPASVTVYDDRGLYEQYNFRNAVANQPIPLAEFSKDYKGYKL